LRPTSLVLILSALAAYTAANLIHNHVGLDPAVAPAIFFVGLLLWRRRRGFLLASAFVIALPAFSFLRWSALTQPALTLPFFNHLALLAAGVLAVGSVAAALLPGRIELQPE
jgi:hypothetical protein